MGDERVTAGDYSYPPGADPDEELLYTIPYGDNEATDLGWAGHVDVAHNLGVESIDTDVLDTGERDGIRYAVARVTVVTGDGGTFSAIQAADEATNQVRDPEFVWAVAESRALKRAVKKAYNIKPASSDAVEEAGSSSYDPPDDVEYEDGHALADDYEADQEREKKSADTGGEW